MYNNQKILGAAELVVRSTVFGNVCTTMLDARLANTRKDKSLIIPAKTLSF